MDLFLCCCLVIYLSFANAQDQPIVQTPLGIVQGTFKKSYSNRTFSAFEGIPYAQPPVGDLRFEEPKPSEGWNGALMANKLYNCMCYLPIPGFSGFKGTEDCLYLYIYVPREQINPNENLDVVVHIHGGGFMLGSPSYMVGPDYIMDKDVVFVSFNYRLGILGFLSTEDDIVSGNNGLKDQSLALRWIKENIKYFGGNANSITLTGLSAGASSVHYHYLSPLSKGLFHRGLSQSGTALLPWALTKNPLKNAKTVANQLNCTTESTRLMIECLKKIDGTALVNSIKILTVYMNFVPFVVFGPVIEKGNNPFLPDHPYKLLQAGQVYDVPWVTSNTRDEGIFPVAFFVFLNKLGEIDSRWEQLSPYLLDFNSTVSEKDKPLLSKKLKEYYMHNKSFSSDNIYDLVKMFSDRLFFIDTEKSLRLHAKAVKSPVYYYWFEYVLQQSFFIPVNINKGVAHSDDSRLMFKMVLAPGMLEQNDEQMMKYLTEFIVDFAKTNKPNINKVEWKPVDPESNEIDYLDIVSPEYVKMKKTKEIGSNELWESFPIKENEKLF